MGTIRWRGRHVFDKLVVKRAEGGPFDQIGQVYHINTASATYPGSDANEGTSFEKPMLTITAALARCVAGRDDYILVHDYWQPTGETWPIAVNKKKVHILGVAQSNFPYPAVHPSTDVAAFTVHEDGSYSEIGLLSIGGGGSYAGISLGPDSSPNTKPEGVWIHNSQFGHSWFGTPSKGIDSLVYGATGLRVEDCRFLGDLVNAGGSIKDNAIDLTTQSADHENLQLLRNIFKGVAIAINLYYAKGGEIRENRFAVPDAQVGEAITLQSTAVGVEVDDNVAMNGMLQSGYTYNPFRDLAANTINAWGRNYRGNAVIEPIGA